MTLEEIKARLTQIEFHGVEYGDDERAHGMEDELYSDFIRFISEGSSHESELAKEILRSKSLNFARWCA